MKRKTFKTSQSVSYGSRKKLINNQNVLFFPQWTGRTNMDAPLAESWLDVDVDLGFALFFFFLLCVFLLVSIVRCSQIVLDPYSAISISIYQEEQDAWTFEKTCQAEALKRSWRTLSSPVIRQWTRKRSSFEIRRLLLFTPPQSAVLFWGCFRVKHSGSCSLWKIINKVVWWSGFSFARPNVFLLHQKYQRGRLFVAMLIAWGPKIDKQSIQLWSHHS